MKNSPLRQLPIVLLPLLISSCLPSDTKEQPKIKLEIASQYYYKMGVPNTKANSSDTTMYNEFGNPTEEIKSGNKTIYKYEKDTLLTSVTEYGKDGLIWYKKNIAYDNSGKKISLNIYQTFTSVKTPELVAGMKFFYDSKNKISEKRYFGAINYTEEEKAETISVGTNAPSISEREKERQLDSASAKYIRNNKGDIERIYFNNDSISFLEYSYDPDGRILSKVFKNNQNTANANSVIEEINRANEFITGKRKSNAAGKYYTYTNGKLSQIKETSSDGYVTIKIFNSNEKISEIHKYINFEEVLWKRKYIYNDDGLLKEVIQSNKIDEPITIDKYEYEYY